MPNHTMIDPDMHLKMQEHMMAVKSMEYKTAHPYFSHNASEHEKEFMTREYPPLIMKYARLMDSIAPKVCEKCDKPLKVPELAWRMAQNIDNFLCYTCIGKLEKEEATLEHNGRGSWTLKQNTDA